MTQIDLSSFGYLLPLLSFLIVFVIVFVVFKKWEVVESPWLQVFIAFLFATVFVTAVGPRDYVLNITVWFAVLVVSLFLLMAMVGFLGKDVSFMGKGIGVVFVVALLLMFLVSAIFVFSNYLSPYLPGSSGAGGNPDVLRFTDWLYSPKVAGAILLLLISAVVSWVLVKK